MIFGFCANLVAAGWVLCTRRSRNRSAGTSQLKVLPPHGLRDLTQLGRFPPRGPRGGPVLHHTNIVPVYAVGEQDGVPYYAMQFIRGQGIDAILDELLRLRQRRARSVLKKGPPDDDKRRPACLTTGAVAIAAVETLAEALLSGEFVVEPDVETAQAESSGMTIDETSKPVNTTTNRTGEIAALRMGTAPASSDRSSPDLPARRRLFSNHREDWRPGR